MEHHVHDAYICVHRYDTPYKLQLCSSTLSRWSAWAGVHTDHALVVATVHPSQTVHPIRHSDIHPRLYGSDEERVVIVAGRRHPKCTKG